MSETESTNDAAGRDPVPDDAESANPFDEDVREADRRNGDPIDVTERTSEGEPVHHDAGGDQKHHQRGQRIDAGIHAQPHL